VASPIAHSLTGVIIYAAWSKRPRITDPVLWLVVFAANLPDLDLIPGLLLGNEALYHRTISHSLTFVASISVLTFVLLKYADYSHTNRIALMFALALLSQIVIDWISYDDSLPAGIAIFWPFSDEYFMSRHTVFLNVRRDNLFTDAVIAHNLRALAREILILGPPLVALWALKYLRRDVGRH